MDVQARVGRVGPESCASAVPLTSADDPVDRSAHISWGKGSASPSTCAPTAVSLSDERPAVMTLSGAAAERQVAAGRERVQADLYVDDGGRILPEMELEVEKAAASESSGGRGSGGASSRS